MNSKLYSVRMPSGNNYFIIADEGSQNDNLIKMLKKDPNVVVTECRKEDIDLMNKFQKAYEEVLCPKK